MSRIRVAVDMDEVIADTYGAMLGWLVGQHGAQWNSTSLQGRQIFDVLTSEVHSGKQPLNWRCRVCGEVLEMPYRRMRNLRRCPACQGDEVRARLIGRMSRNPARD